MRLRRRAVTGDASGFAGFASPRGVLVCFALLTKLLTAEAISLAEIAGVMDVGAIAGAACSSSAMAATRGGDAPLTPSRATSCRGINRNELLAATAAARGR